MSLLDPLLKRWPLVAILSSLLMLAIAHAFETFGHLPPCHLCLLQRDVYWSAIFVGAAVWLIERTAPRWRGLSPRWLLALVFAAGVGVAAYHAGVEWKWWPGPASCTTSGATHISSADLAGMLNGTRKINAPMCDKAAWVFLGLSMAGWNTLVSLKLTILSALSAPRRRRR
jgi:disulfide bond formation protein DsbB